jgi:hypothetical protein
MGFDDQPSRCTLSGTLCLPLNAPTDGRNTDGSNVRPKSGRNSSPLADCKSRSDAVCMSLRAPVAKQSPTRRMTLLDARVLFSGRLLLEDSQ